MGHGEPDEPDRPGCGGGSAAEQHHRQGGHRAHEPDALAERSGDVLAERQPVEGAAGADGEDDAHDDERRDRAGDVEVAAGHRSDGPEPVLVEGGRVEQEHRRGERAHQRRHGGAGDGQLHRCGPASSRSAEDVHERAGRGGAGEREPHQARSVGDAELRDGDDHEQRRAGVHPEQARVGEGVAGHALHHRAGQAEGGPDHQCQDGPGQAQLPDDEMVLEGPVVVEHGVPGVAPRHGLGADGDRGQGGQHHQAQQQEQAGAERDPPTDPRRRTGGRRAIR